MAPDTREPASPIALKDAALLRQQCYVDGRWTDVTFRIGLIARLLGWQIKLV